MDPIPKYIIKTILRLKTIFTTRYSVAPYVASPMLVVRKMLEIAELKEQNTVYDLGCGDGRIVILAAQEFGADGVGIELNPTLVKEAQAKVDTLGLSEKVKILHGNLFELDLHPADIVTMYLTTGANEKIRPKLEKELMPSAKVVTHDFSIRKWDPIKQLKFKEGYRTHTIYLYQLST